VRKPRLLLIATLGLAAVLLLAACGGAAPETVGAAVEVAEEAGAAAKVAEVAGQAGAAARTAEEASGAAAAARTAEEAASGASGGSGAGAAASGAGAAASGAGAAAVAEAGRALAAAEVLAAAEATSVAGQADAVAATIVGQVAHQPNLKADFVQDIVEATKEAVRAMVCDLAASQVLPQEKAKERQGDDGVLPSPVDLAEGVVTRLAVKWTGVASVYNWSEWAVSVENAGSQLVRGVAGGTIQGPQGPVSQSFLFYARACLAAPGA
jgi:hypothetical protein